MLFLFYKYCFLLIKKNRRTSLVATRFRGCATAWWQQLKTSCVRARKPKIVSWDKLKKKHIRRAFLPYNYERTMYERLQNLRQGNRMVDKYALEFCLLLTCNEITEANAQLVSRFIGGLRQQYQNILNLFDPLTVSEAHQRALLIDKQSRSGSLASTTPPDRTPTSLTTTAFESVSAPSPTITATAPRPLPAPLNIASFGQPSRLDAMRCFSCSELGHRQTACPKLGKRTLLVDGMELEDFNDVIVDDDILEDDILE